MSDAREKGRTWVAIPNETLEEIKDRISDEYVSPIDLAIATAPTIDPALVERAQTMAAALSTMRRMREVGAVTIGMPPVRDSQLVAAEREEREARLAVADTVLAQFAAKPEKAVGKFAMAWEISVGFAQRRNDDGRQVAYVLTEGDDWQWFAPGASGEAPTCAEAMRMADAALDADGYGESVVGEVDRIVATLGAKPPLDLLLVHGLDAYGAAIQMPRIAGEPDDAYRERMVAVMMRVRS